MRHPALVLALTLVLAPSARAVGRTDAPDVRRYLAKSGARAVNGPTTVPLSVVTLLVPGYARQTGMACSACHYQFPQLTAFGRQFKLNGYVLSTVKHIEQAADSTRMRLSLPSLPPISMMLVGSATQLGDALPGTQNGTVALPQQLSLFLAGAITPRIGTFTQVTYSASGNTFSIDNTDIRYADKATLGETSLQWGVTLNNNPTVQDLWNTTPAWGAPFLSSATTPGQAANPLISGALAQQVVGLGLYGMWNDLLYTEVSAYRSSVPGGASPLDSSARGVLSGLAPYWRVALQKTFGQQYLMVGTFGMSARRFPAGVSGLTDTYTDIAFDAQHEMPVGDGHLVTRLSFINENQTLDASFASTASAHATNSLQTLRLNSSWYISPRFGLSAGVFTTTGTADTLLFAPGAVSGSANGKPDTRGGMLELSVNTWDNARFLVQYTLYDTFNGGSANYDGSGRKASSNNALYLAWWLAF
ncbi:MAG: cytochrome C [Gemmatimonadetes bacterium]|nr:cytochrome C [Gemmatimonadota bacterium]